jgi:hypothetical protein
VPPRTGATLINQYQFKERPKKSKQGTTNATGKQTKQAPRRPNPLTPAYPLLHQTGMQKPKYKTRGQPTCRTTPPRQPPRRNTLTAPSPSSHHHRALPSPTRFQIPARLPTQSNRLHLQSAIPHRNPRKRQAPRSARPKCNSDTPHTLSPGPSHRFYVLVTKPAHLLPAICRHDPYTKRMPSR